MADFADSEALYQQQPVDEPLLERHPLSKSRWRSALVATSGLLSVACALVWAISGPIDNTIATKATLAAAQWHGVSLGGWLVMEINPSQRGPTSPMDLRPQWMYDQIEANSELDFVSDLRREHGDAFAIQTMKNHWAGYITEEMLDTAQELGISAMRIPVGYWIMDKPVGGSSPLEYGISPEGFITGGLNHLHAMLVEMKKRGMSALIDIHAHPCNSACVSNGLYCASPLAFGILHEWPIPEGTEGSIDTVGIKDMPRCAHADPKGGLAYKTTRDASEGTWTDVAVTTVGSLAKWIAELPAEAACVTSYQLANEPALGPDIPAVTKGINKFYERAMAAARLHLPTIPLVLSWINPSPQARAPAISRQLAISRLACHVFPFLKSAGEADAKIAGGGVLSDHHYYLNWQGWMLPPGEKMPWKELIRRACILEAENNWHVVDEYAEVEQEIIIGEWSLATNMDAPLDLADSDTLANLGLLYKAQLEAFGKVGVIRGSFFWTLRMGSGWDPRPTATHPHGKQVGGTSGSKSADGYPFQVWSLLEMARLGVATPLDKSYEGTCAAIAA